MWTESLWAFLRATLPDRALKQWWTIGRQKGSTKVSLCNYYTFLSMHDSDHEGVVRIFAALSWSCEVIYLFN